MFYNSKPEPQRSNLKLEPSIQFARRLNNTRKISDEVPGFVDVPPFVVDQFTPMWTHDMMYRFARAFRREFSYDFIQWDRYRECDPNYQGIFLHDTTGEKFDKNIVLGGVSFRYRMYHDAESAWAIQWIWLKPQARHHGILSQWWPYFEKTFSKPDNEFHIEGPLSDEMFDFVMKKGFGHRVTGALKDEHRAAIIESIYGEKE